MRRSAGSEQLDEGKALEGIYRGDDEYVERGGHNLRPFDFPEHLTAVCAVNLRRLNKRLVNVAKRRNIEHDGLTDGRGEEDEDYAPQGKARIAQPVDVLLNDAGALQKIVEHTVAVVVHPLPHNGHGNRAGDDRQIEDAAERGGQRGLHVIYCSGDPQGERAHCRHGDNDNHNGVFQRAEKQLVLKQFPIIIQPNKDIHGIFAHIGIKQAGVYAHKHGIQHKSDKEKQARQQKQVSRCCFPPHKRAAHAVI